MAKKETVVLSCDLHEGEMTDGVQTVAFSLDGQPYEVEACEAHRNELHDAFAPYVGAARKAGSATASSAPRRSGRGSARPAAPSGGGTDKAEIQRVREWARENGHKVSERGRLSSSVLEAYRAAH